MHSRLEMEELLSFVQVALTFCLLRAIACLLALVNDLVTRDKTSEVKTLFARRKNLLVPDDLTGVFWSPAPEY